MDLVKFSIMISSAFIMQPAFCFANVKFTLLYICVTNRLISIVTVAIIETLYNCGKLVFLVT